MFLLVDEYNVMNREKDKLSISYTYILLIEYYIIALLFNTKFSNIREKIYVHWVVVFVCNDLYTIVILVFSTTAWCSGIHYPQAYKRSDFVSVVFPSELHLCCVTCHSAQDDQDEGESKLGPR